MTAGKGLLDDVLKKSIIIEGMRTGKLDPDVFSRFELQDGRYLQGGRDILMDKGNILKVKFPGFHEMCEGQAKIFDDHHQLLLKKYNMGSFDCVILHPAIQQYLDFLKNDERIKTDPRRLLFAMLSCSHSWRYISGVILPNVNPESVYKEKWIVPNFREEGYESDLEKFINQKIEEKMFSEEEIKILEGLYFDAMRHEAELILKGGDPLM